MTPLVVEFDVDATVDHAFAMWTGRTELWWPRSHAMSGPDLADVTFEQRVGGRIFERSQDGTEHEWGEVTAWDPPGRIGYLWHLFFDRSEATHVDVTFVATNHGTHVTIEQTGFEHLGAAGAPRRERTDASWRIVTEAFVAAV